MVASQPTVSAKKKIKRKKKAQGEQSRAVGGEDWPGVVPGGIANE